MVVCGVGLDRVGIHLDVVDYLYNVVECLWGLYVSCGFGLVVHAYHGCEGQLCLLIVFWPYWVIAYSDHYCVDVGMFRDWKLSWCPIFVVDYWDGYHMRIFFGCHSSLP